MPPQCEKKQATIRVNIHLPATDWHPHVDKVLKSKNETEWGAWAESVLTSLGVLCHNNARLMVGYWGDVLNSMPVEYRKALVNVIVQGLGIEIKKAEQPDSIEVDLVPRYEPLAPQAPNPGELVVAKHGTDLIVPGDPWYTGGS